MAATYRRSPEQFVLYDMLGVAPSATPDEIAAAYRRLAKRWHPDVCKEPNAAQMFSDITHAYDVLSDPQKRAEYDLTGRHNGRREETPPIDGRALNLIQNTIEELVARQDFDTTDFVGALRLELREIHKVAAANAKNADPYRRQMEKYSKLLGRLKHKGGNNYVGEALGAKVQKLKETIDAIEAEVADNVAMCDRAIKLFEAGSYEFAFDRPAPAYQPGHFTYTNPTQDAAQQRFIKKFLGG